MNRTNAQILSAMLIVLLAAAGLLAEKSESTPVYDIPLVKQVAVDGKADDWADAGFRVEMMKQIWGG